MAVRSKFRVVRARKRARRNFFEIRKVQIILHPLAIFGFSISLKLSVIERFEKSAVLVPKPRIRVKKKRSPLTMGRLSVVDGFETNS